jgi:hypothetical protein
MVDLSLASNPTEERKFFCDDEARSGTPGLDVVRVGMPSLSRAWGSISIVVVSRNADVAQAYHRSSDSKWRYDEEDHCSGEQGYRWVNEAELTLGPQSAHAPDPRLVEFVRLLARRAAREWYEQIVKERHPKRS